MLVPVMHVRVVRMSMFQRFVCVQVRVRFLARPLIRMRVLVMRIMDMRVFVFHGQMAMQVRVAFREVQPHAGPHE
jgi:hypothetical protein